MKLISTIAAELRQSNPEIGRPTAQDLNNMLIVKGLIRSIADGKCPTLSGSQVGIRKRIGWDTSGHRYCTPEYDERAERYVKSLAIEYFSEIAAQVNAPLPSEVPVAPAPPASMPTTPVIESLVQQRPQYHYTHRDFDSIKIQFRDHLIILEGPDSYWTYFQDARTLCSLMRWDVYVNHKNIPGITFPKNELPAVLQILDNNQIEWVVWDHLGERRSAEYSLTANIETPDTTEDTIEIGSYVRVRINNSVERSFFVRDSHLAPVIAHISANGMVISTGISGFEEDSVSIDSPAGRALLGRRVGEIVQI